MGLLNGQSGYAQDAPRWFQVELLVFSHKGASGDEQFEPTPVLAYPGAGRFLIEPQRVKANRQAYDADSVVDEFGRQLLTELPPRSSAPRKQSAQVAAPNNVPVLQPTPFIALPSAQREFNGKAAYMQRSGRYQTLFHQSWAQPVLSQGRALPLILDRSGDTGEWSRLQGSVTVYLSRYLHLETNLWLNTNGDYLPGEWRMPAPPLGPPSLIVEALPGEPSQEGFGERWTDSSTASAADADNESELGLEQAMGPVYPYRHAVLLQQKRRMRSTEVHYIDHPKLGVVIKLTPLTKENLEIMAAAEAASDFVLNSPAAGN
jgi:hypothetical protein